MIEKHFSKQIKIMLEAGHIPEKFYYALGFPKDEVSGIVYDCNDVIEIQWIQREELLTHWFQQHLRLASQKKIEDQMKKGARKTEGNKLFHPIK